MQFQFLAKFCPGETALAEFGEQTELDGGEQDLGRPERESGLKNLAWIQLLTGIGHEGFYADPEPSASFRALRFAHCAFSFAFCACALGRIR